MFEIIGEFLVLGRFFTLAAFVILAVVLIGATIPSFIDWQTYREPIENAASDAVGREVKIEGKVGFTILPRPAVDLGKVSIANSKAGEAEHLLTLELLSARLALTPLLRGAIQVETFELEGADLRLERNGENVNWSLTRKDENGSEKSAADNFLIRAIQDISIEDFSAKDLRISYTDVVSGKSFGWEVKHGTAILESMNGPFSAEGRIVLGDEAFFVTGKVGVSREGNPRPILLEAVAGNGLSVKYDGSASFGQDAFGVSGALDLSSPSLNDLAVPFAAITGTSSNAWAGNAKLTMPTTLKGQMEISGGAITATGMELSLADQKATADVDLKLGKVISGTIDLESNILDIDAMAGGFDAGTIGARPVGPKVDVAINVRTRNATVRETRLGALDFSIYLTPTGPAIGSFDVTLPGHTRTIYTLVDAPTHRGKLDLKSSDARTFLDWVGVDLKGSKKSAFKSLKLEGDVLVNDKEIKMTGMDATLDGVSIEGAFVRTRTKRPSFGANLEIRELDLGAIGMGSDVDAWLNYMKAFDLNLILKLRRFSGFDLERRSVDLKAQVVNGNMTLEDMQLYGTPDVRLRGKLRHDENGKLAGRMRVDGKKVKLCEPMEARAGLAIPGCDADKAFKVNADFDITAGMISGPAKGSTKGLSFEGRLGGVETLFEKTLRLDYRGKGDIGSVTYALKGDVRGKTLKTNLEAEAASLDEFLGIFPSLGSWSETISGLIKTDGSTAFTADFKVAADAMTMENMELLLGSAKFSGGGALPARGAPMDMTLSVSDVAVLNAFEPGKWSRKKLDLAIPQEAEGTFKLSMQNVALAGIAIPVAKLDGTVKSGGLKLNVEEAEAFSGRWAGEFSVHPGKNGLYVLAEGEAEEIAMGQFLTTIFGSKALSGGGNLKYSISADGSSTAAMAKSSAGIIEAELGYGTLRGVNMRTFSEGLINAEGELGARLVAEETLGKGRTDVSRIVAEMTLADGRLRTSKLEGDLEKASFKGDGSLDLSDFALKGRISFDLDDHNSLPDFYSNLSGKLTAPRSAWDAEELILKYTEEWLLANQALEAAAEQPAVNDVGIVTEDLGDLPILEEDLAPPGE